MPAARTSTAAPIPRVLERLLAERKISADHFDVALGRWRREGGSIEDALFETEHLSELDLLRALAALYHTRFVSTEKLSKADIDRSTLELVPRKVAERHCVFPVLHDRHTATLSVVTPDPENVRMLEEVRVVSRVREVKAFVGRPLAVKAAIAKTYGGDARAFAIFDQRVAEPRPHVEAAEAIDAEVRAAVAAQQISSTFERTLVFSSTPPANGQSDEREVDGVATTASTPPVPSLERTPIAAVIPSLSPPPIAPPAESWLDTLNVLVSLLENNRADLRGHSAQVARVTRRLCERIGLAERDTDAVVAAAFLHDLGKASSYHLTGLNVAEYDGHRVAAKKAHLMPVRLMEAARLHDATVRAIHHMYERFDGKGLPDGLSGKDIPLGARILSITDTYADLTQNPRNPFRRMLKPAEASDVLTKFRSSIFDPNLVDVFRNVVTGDDLKAKLLANRRLALLVDPDPEETTVLELRLLEQGFEVRIVRTADQALKAITDEEVEVVVSEVDLLPFDGFELLSRVHHTERWPDIAWVFLSTQAGRDDVNRGFELGALDFFEKPVKAELLVAKLRKLVEHASKRQIARGVSGSLEEMSLPDMVQVLAQGRKTGALKIRSQLETGELLFVAGEIFNASWGRLRGEEAFYAMLHLSTGEFSLDPNVKADARVIGHSAEGLLLEGMRRLDERSRPPRI